MKTRAVSVSLAYKEFMALMALDLHTFFPPTGWVVITKVTLKMKMAEAPSAWAPEQMRGAEPPPDPESHL